MNFFVSFHFEREDGATGFGDTIYTVRHPRRLLEFEATISQSDLDDLRKHLRGMVRDVRNVTILNYTALVD